VEALLKINPEWNKEDVEKIVEKEMKENFQNPMVELDNNYTKKHEDATLLSTFDWILENEPIIAGNGSIFKNQLEAPNPIADMLDGFLKDRSRIKKEMFKIKDANSSEYKMKDLHQSIKKVNANSYYGGSGMPSSAFYNVWCARSTTASAQSVISTCYSTFESFISNNLVFYDINEYFNWIKVFDEYYKDCGKNDKWLKAHDVDEVFDKIQKMFFKWKDSYSEPIFSQLSNMDKDKLNRLYYVNDLMGFTKDHSKVRSLNAQIIDNVTVYPIIPKNKKKDDWEKYIPKELEGKFLDADEYNKFAQKESFMNPNDVPDSVKDLVTELSSLYLKYVYLPFMVFDRIYRLKNFGRKCVVVIDTDSNIITLDKWVEFIEDEIVSKECKSDKSKDNKEFIIINSITYTITSIANDILLRYGDNSNIPENIRPRYKMKNEFYMKRLIISEVKKRYMSLFKLREGNYLDPPKIDIKGMDFRKSSTSDICEDIFTKLCEKYLLNSEIIDVKALREELKNLEKRIYESILSGNTEFLPIASVKEFDAYKEPGREQSVRGALVWNMVYPENPIEIPSKVKMIKLTCFNEEDILPLKQTEPEIYDALIEGVFRDKSGIFIVPNNKGNKSKGLQVLAIPSYETIPEWVKPFIDYNNNIGTILSPFKSVTDLLKLTCVETGYVKNGVNRHVDSFTNIISF